MALNHTVRHDMKTLDHIKAIQHRRKQAITVQCSPLQIICLGTHVCFGTCVSNMVQGEGKRHRIHLGLLLAKHYTMSILG